MGHVLEVDGEEPIADHGGLVERLRLLGEDLPPARLLGVGRIDRDDPPVGRVPVGHDQELVAHVVDDVVAVLERGDDRPKGAVGPGEVANPERVAVVPRLAPVGDAQHQEPLVIGDPGQMEPLGVGRIVVDQVVLRLRGAKPVIEDLVVLVGAGEGLGRVVGHRVAAVVEAVAIPAQPRHLDPSDQVGEGVPGGGLHDVIVLPVRSAARESVGEVFAVAGEGRRAEPDGAVGGERVGIDQDVAACPRAPAGRRRPPGSGGRRSSRRGSRGRCGRAPRCGGSCRAPPAGREGGLGTESGTDSRK